MDLMNLYLSLSEIEDSARRIGRTPQHNLVHTYELSVSIRTAQNFNSGCLDTGSNAGFVT